MAVRKAEPSVSLIVRTRGLDSKLKRDFARFGGSSPGNAALVDAPPPCVPVLKRHQASSV